ncbi:unnamed protein product [Ectocarpus sp. 8 AP-2014]
MSTIRFVSHFRTLSRLTANYFVFFTPGYYSSWLLISYTVGGLLSSYPWGIFADRFGRKPVMLIGVCGTGLFSIAFGMSETLAAAMISRFLFGLANSIIPVARIMAVELLGPDKAVVGIALLPGTRAIGSIIGPTIGGQLAQPSIFHPSSFSSTGFFARYPFLLPNLAVAFLAFATLPLALLVLPETLSTARRGQQDDVHTSGNRRDRTATPTATCCALKRATWQYAQDTAAVAGDGGGIVLVDSPEKMIDSSEDECPPQDHCSVGKLSAVGSSQAAAAGRGICRGDGSSSRSSSSSRSRSRSNDSISRRGEVKAPLLDKKGHRRKISNYSAEEVCGDDPSPRHLRRSGSTARDGESSLCGPGGLLTPRRVRLLVLMQCLVSMMDVGFVQMYPLWLLASKDSGGLEWTVPKIGKVLGWSGVGQLLFQFFVYPALCKTIGIVWLLRGSSVLAAASFIFVPDIQRANWSENGSCVVGAAIVIFLGSCISVIETAMNLASANAVPVPMRGKIGGIFAVASSFGRVIGPAGLCTLLAWSLQSSNMLLDYHAVFVVEMVLMSVMFVLGRNVLTLEALTIPIEDRHGADYESISVSSTEITDTSSQIIAGDTMATSKVDNRPRRRDLSAV